MLSFSLTRLRYLHEEGERQACEAGKSGRREAGKPCFNPWTNFDAGPSLGQGACESDCRAFPRLAIRQRY